MGAAGQRGKDANGVGEKRKAEGILDRAVNGNEEVDDKGRDGDAGDAVEKIKESNEGGDNANTNEEAETITKDGDGALNGGGDDQAQKEDAEHEHEHEHEQEQEHEQDKAQSQEGKTGLHTPEHHHRTGDANGAMTADDGSLPQTPAFEGATIR